MDVTVKTSSLREIVQEHLGAHLLNYEAAVKIWDDTVQNESMLLGQHGLSIFGAQEGSEIADARATLKKALNSPPVDLREKYCEVLAMLTMHKATSETITLEQYEYLQFVRDEFQWRAAAKFVNDSYTRAKAGR